MAYQPDDDRFYDSLNGAGRDYQNLRGRVAEEQAASTRELGQMYGQMAPNLVNAGMQGADWRMKRAKDQQWIDQSQANEGRSQTEEGRKATQFQEAEQDRTAHQAAAAAQHEYDVAPAEEGYARGAGVQYQPGMTHLDVERMAGANKMGFQDRDLQQKGDIAANTLTGENTRAAATLGGENARAANTLAFDQKKLDQEGELKKLELGTKTGQKPPAELISKLGEADSAEKALQSLGAEWSAKASAKGSGLKQYINNSDAARYRDATRLNAQVIGRFLEDGKLTDADIPRYESMLPDAFDSPDRASEKLSRMSALMAGKKAAHVKALTDAGYSVGNIQASGKGSDFHLGAPKAAPGTALADDANADLSPEDLQAKMIQAATEKPVDQMTREEVQAHLRALKGGH